MAIQYSSGGQIYTNFTTTTGTRREIVDGIAAALISAGWSYQSGSGTGDVKMLTATTPQGSKCVVRIYDPGSGNCARLQLYNQGNTISQAGGCYLLPAAGKVFRVIANAYQFFVFVLGSTSAREFAAGGTPWLPSWNSSITECGWLISSAQGDSDSTLRPSFRTSPITVAAGASYPNMCAFINTTIWENNGGNFGVNWAPGIIGLAGFGPLQYVNNNSNVQHMNKWYDGSGYIYEPIIGWAISAPASTAGSAVGQLWDAAMMSVPFAIDTTTTFDSHNWLNIMSNNTGSNQNFGQCSLFLVTP